MPSELRVVRQVGEHQLGAGAVRPDEPEVCVADGAAILPEALTARPAEAPEACAAATDAAASTPSASASASAPCIGPDGARALYTCTCERPTAQSDYPPLIAPPAAAIESIRQFFGLATFPFERLFARSAAANSLVLIAEPITRLLRAGGADDLRVVHTGVRVFESDSARGVGCAYRACQDGLALLVPHATRQRVAVRTAMLLELLNSQAVAREAYARHGVATEHCAAGSVILDVTLDGDAAAGGGASGDAGLEHGGARDDWAVSLAAMLTPSGNLQLMVSKEERRGLAMRLQRGARGSSEPA